MSGSYHNPLAHSGLRAGIFGAIANLIISGSSLFCLLVFVSFGSASAVPGIWLVFVVPFLLIGFAAGSVSSLYRFGRLMALFAALLGSSIGFLAGALLLDLLETNGQTNYEGYPIFKYAGWEALGVTVVGTALATVVILLAGLIRRVFNRVG